MLSGAKDAQQGNCLIGYADINTEEWTDKKTGGRFAP